MWPSRIPPAAREVLDELDVSAILEYVAARLGLTVGRRELRTRFRDGRYDRTVDERGRSISTAGGRMARKDRPVGP